jgi:hypothetical protein
MRCWRFDLRRKFVPYLEGALRPRETEGVERHLRACAKCRAVFVRLRAGDQSARELRRFGREEAHRPPEFETMKAEVREVVAKRDRWARAWEDRFYELTTPRTVQILAGLVLVLGLLLVVSNRRVLFGGRNGKAAKPFALDVSDFHPLRIPEIQSNTRARITTEGYVRDVRLDEEEGTLQFKLAEIPQGAGPFVVCEIMSPIGIARPREGSLVRVYGVARYDGQPGREWHEVNPVLDIAVLKN